MPHPTKIDTFINERQVRWEDDFRDKNTEDEQQRRSK